MVLGVINVHDSIHCIKTLATEKIKASVKLMITYLKEKTSQLWTV